MRARGFLSTAILAILSLGMILQSSAPAQSLKEQNEALFERLQHMHGLSDRQMQSIRAIFSKAPYIGQGNPAISQHPVTPQR